MPPKIPHYNLNAPTEATAFSSFERVLGSDEADAVWQNARAAAGFTQRDDDLSLQQLRLVAEILAGREDFVGVLGVSLRIRIDTFQNLLPFAEQENAVHPNADLS